MTANENDKLRIRVDKANDALTSPGESIGKRFGDGDPWAMRVAAFAFGMLAFLIGLRLLASWIQLSGKTNVEVAPRDPQDGFTAGSR
jgi:hypothetical protein